MLCIARSIQISNNLASPFVQAQRGYAVAKKVIKMLDEKLIPPKRPLNAYLQFHREVFNSLPPAEKTNISITSKLVGEKWHKLSDLDKKHYQDLAQKSREVYEIKFKEFINSLEPVDFAKLAKVRRLGKAQGKTFPRFKDPNAPKKPKTSYVYFLKEKYPQLSSDNSSTDAFRKIAEEWRQIPESSKKHYEQLAIEDKSRYEREMKEYMQ